MNRGYHRAELSFDEIVRRFGHKYLRLQRAAKNRAEALRVAHQATSPQRSERLRRLKRQELVARTEAHAAAHMIDSLHKACPDGTMEELTNWVLCRLGSYDWRRSYKETLKLIDE